jgi:hypothetical protein
MAKKTKALKEQATDKTPERLKERAQELISEALDAAADRQDSGDNKDYAERLLRQLEPIVSEYAPPPRQVVRILEDKAILKTPSALRLERLPRQQVAKLSKDVYSDKRGDRLARRKRPGWQKVKY